METLPMDVFVVKGAALLFCGITSRIWPLHSSMEPLSTCLAIIASGYGLVYRMSACAAHGYHARASSRVDG
jgi:hypothetical protein